MVLRGDFRPGERLSEVPLATRLGVSRTPVRLALERLALEGLLITSDAGGFTVRTYTIVEIWDAIELRAVLEGTAARLAAERLIDLGELKPLRACCDEIDALAVQNTPAGEQQFNFLLRYSDLNDKFHAALVDLSRSTMVKSTLARLHSIPFATPSAARIPGALQTTLATGLEQHHAIIEAIANKDGARAESVAREHARLGRKNLEVAIQYSARYFVGQSQAFEGGAEIIAMPTRPHKTLVG